MRRFLSIFKDERAATAIEYCLIVGLVFMALLVGASAFGNSAISMWEFVENEVTTD